MRPVVGWLLAGSLAIVALAILVAYGWLRGSLPDLDGDVRVTGLSAAAAIERDAQGIATITATGRTDLAFATGFAHAQDRFFQMDLIRRRSAGELAELFGGVALDSDRWHRLHRFRARADAALATAPEADRALLAAYAGGVNAGLASLSRPPFEYALIGAEPAPWQPADSLLAAYTMYVQLNDSKARRDVHRGLAKRVMPAAVYDFLYPAGTRWDAPLDGEAFAPAAVPPAEIFSIRDVPDDAPPNREQGKVALPGSNNWAVAGSLTADGRALVANDMHLGHSVPNVWYRARLIVDAPGGIDVSGVTLPGAPFVVAGSNGRVAWGFTNSQGDWTDAVVVRPGRDPDHYQTLDGDRPFRKFEERIRVRDGDDVTMTVRETVWGPVFDGHSWPDGDIAISWVAHAPQAMNLRLVDLETVADVSAALDVANLAGMPAQNFVAGDADGNIGWTLSGRMPLRGDYDARVPVDGARTPAWIGWHVPADYPRIVNPPAGRLWTANARVVTGDALRMVGNGGYDLGARARQIRDRLFAADRFDAASMLAIQVDDRALFLTPWRDLLLDLLSDAAVDDNAARQEYRRIIADWIPRAAPESAGYRLVRTFRLDVESRIANALLRSVRDAYAEPPPLRISNQFEGSLWTLVTERPMHLLPADYASWEDFLLTVVDTNIAYFDAEFDGPLAERTWGEYNRVELRHPLSGAVPLIARWLDMPVVALPGDHDMPRAQGRRFGASERFAVAPGNEEEGLMQMPAGQSGHPLSPYYAQGHEQWVEGSAAPFLPGSARHRLTLLPAHR